MSSWFSFCQGRWWEEPRLMANLCPFIHVLRLVTRASSCCYEISIESLCLPRRIEEDEELERNVSQKLTENPISMSKDDKSCAIQWPARLEATSDSPPLRLIKPASRSRPLGGGGTRRVPSFASTTEDDVLFTTLATAKILTDTSWVPRPQGETRAVHFKIWGCKSMTMSVLNAFCIGSYVDEKDPWFGAGISGLRVRLRPATPLANPLVNLEGDVR